MTTPDANAPERLLQDAIDALPDAIFVKDADGRYRVFNEAFVRSRGFARDTILGRTDEELHELHPGGPVAEANATAASDPSPVREDTDWTVDPSGTRRLIHTVRATLPGGGEVAAGRDISRGAHRDQGDAAEGPELIAAAPVAIYWKDAEGNFSGANDAFAWLVGVKDPGEVTGRRDDDFPWQPLEHGKLDEEVVRTGTARRDVERREVDRYGRRRWTETTVVPRRDHRGQVIGTIGTCRDVTAQRHAARASERAGATAERANRAKSAFVIRMSHALRTPLTALLGFVELARDPNTDDSTRLDHLERIRDNGWEVLGLVNDLLDLSRIEGGRLSIRTCDIEIRSLLDDLADAVRPRLEASKGSLEIKVDEAVAPQLRSDPIRIRQTLAALVERAIRQAPGTMILLRVTPTTIGLKDGLSFEIVDDGPTVPEDELSARLRPMDAISDLELTDRGLGLALAFNIAELLEGRIETAHAGHGDDGTPTGNRFTLTVPVRIERESTADEADDAENRGTNSGQDPWRRVEDAARSGLAWFADPGAAEAETADAPESADGGAPHAEAPAEAPPAASEAEADRQIRILLAEDTPDTARFLQLVLESGGYEVTHAANGSEAMAAVATASERGEEPDIVLTDVQMPEVDGLELTRRLRTIGFSQPIVALSAHATEEHRRAALEAGCNDHLGKPITPTALLELVAKHLEESRRGRIDRAA